MPFRIIALLEFSLMMQCILDGLIRELQEISWKMAPKAPCTLIIVYGLRPQKGSCLVLLSPSNYILNRYRYMEPKGSCVLQQAPQA